MNKSILIISTLLLVCMAGCINSKTEASKNKQTKKPNIIILLLDDAGYADFGFAGCKDLKTPNIDSLANNGIVFTDAYVSASVCGPSRAGLLTGRYQQRFGFECNPSGEIGIDLNEMTIADAMKQAGYKTAAFGKWHLGGELDFRPNSRGFDYFWGFLAGGRSYFPNNKDDKKGDLRSIRENDKFTQFEGYLTDVLGKKTAEFIDRNKEKPFFIYWAPNAVHTPMEATEEDLALFEGHPRQRLAAMTWALDRAVGNITAKLHEESLLDNTLIFFLSDNGGAHNNESSNLPLKGFKGNKYEGGLRVPFFIHWPAKFKGGTTFNGLTSSLDIFATSIDATGEQITLKEPLDGISLIPYLTSEKEGDPHDKLFWRKDQAAAARVGDYKLIRVEELGNRLYNLEVNLGETNDLSNKEPEVFEELNSELQNWESVIIPPQFIESEEWNKVTWMIHEDLFLNRKVRVKNPGQLVRYNEQKNK